MSSARTVLHFCAAAHFWMGCYYDWNYVNIPIEVHPIGFSFGGTRKLKFLTFWDALLQAAFFSICVLNDVIGSNENYPKPKPFIRKLKDIILAGLAFPISMFVGITFWALYTVDRELVFPKAIDEFFPSWLNHVMHTNVMIFILIELYTSYREYPPRKLGIQILSLFMIVYLIWVHIIHAYSGIWVYPVLDVLNFPLRLLFFISSLGLGISLYLMGEKLNSIFWSSQIKSKGHKSK